MKTTPLTPEFWIAEWNASQERMALLARQGYTGRDLWNRMASEYGGGRTNDSYHKSETEGLVARLTEYGLLRPRFRVLDVGCGPGGKALAFAGHGADVVALDFSEKMLDRLRRSVPADLAGSVEPVEADWEDVDLADRGWEGVFDLVFVSMTPGVRTPEAFLKLHRASRHGCYFRGWAGRRTDVLLAGLWRHLKDEPMPPMCGDIVQAFNLLYAMGLSPRIEFSKIGWATREPVAKTSAFCRTFFADMTNLNAAELGARIDGYLSSVAQDGQVLRKTEGRIGTMTWEVA